MAKKSAGFVFSNGMEVGATAQCVHCGAHFLFNGSLKGRGYCSRCDGYFCGKGCLEHKPWMQKIEEAEGDRSPTLIIPV